MTATFMAFQVAGRAMEASQASINVTGNNIANINTDGYTRQRVDVNSITNSGYAQKYASPQISTGIGAKAMGTSQLRDPFIDARYRAQNAETSRYATRVSGLMDLEDVMDEASTEGLQAELSSFIDDLQSFSETPKSPDIAQVTRSAAQKVTQIINMYANQIETIRDQQVEDLDVVVKSDFNTYIENIANLNDQIRKEQIYGNTPNELYDQRNLLIDKLSAVASIKVSSSSEVVSENLSIEKLTISMIDPTTDPVGMITVVDNEKYGELSLSDKDGKVDLTIVDASGATYEKSNAYFTDGAAKAYLEIINGEGAGGSSFRGVSYYAKKLDAFASKFADVFNKINSFIDPKNPVYPKDPADPLDLVDLTDPKYLTDSKIKPLFTNSKGEMGNKITAKNIQISEAWLDNPEQIKTTNSTTTTGGADNILRMVAAMSDQQTFEGAAEKSSFHEYMTSLLGDVSMDVDLNTKFADTANLVQENIFTTRESTSGVSLNEEGVNLMAYQKVYSAAMRYFNVLDENLNTLINTMGQ